MALIKALQTQFESDPEKYWNLLIKYHQTLIKIGDHPDCPQNLAFLVSRVLTQDKFLWSTFCAKK